MPEDQPNNPLHGLTLEAILLLLVEKYGWEGLAQRIPVRCFSSDPSVSSSLAFLRRTPWARAKVEALYLGRLRPRRKGRGPNAGGGTTGRGAGRGGSAAADRTGTSRKPSFGGRGSQGRPPAQPGDPREP